MECLVDRSHRVLVAMITVAAFAGGRPAAALAQTTFFDVEFTSATHFEQPTPTGLSPSGKPVWQSTGGASASVGGEWPTLGSWNNYLGDSISTAADNPFSLAGGLMTLTLQRGKHPVVSYDPTLANFVGGMLNSFTLPHGTFTGARIEVRAKMPTGGAANSGVWPAIWLTPVSNSTLAEIDIVELLGRDPLDMIHVTTHYGADGNTKASNSQAPIVNGDTSQWHIYGVDFDSTKSGSSVKFYFDDVLVATAPMQGTMLHGGPWFLMINNAVGIANSWPCNYGAVAGCPSLSAPVKLQVDYVRMYAPGTVIAAH